MYQLLLLLLLLNHGGSIHGHIQSHRKLADSSSQNRTTCPLDFSVLSRFAEGAKQANLSRRCQYSLQGLHLVLAEFLRTNGLFLPPLNSSDSCWNDFETAIHGVYPNFNIRSSCGFETSWISQGCMNITTRAQFEAQVPESSIRDMKRLCNQSLENNAPCSGCTATLSSTQAAYLPGDSIGNMTVCSNYASIYAAALVNQYGPTDQGTALCLFLLPLPSNLKKHKAWVYGLVVACLVLIGAVFALGFLRARRYNRKRAIERRSLMEKDVASGLDSMKTSATLVRFTFEDIKASTGNFSRHNIIGKGSYGNVYKGTLADGTEVALKRFKNCSAAGDAGFVHEVEVIASVRHRNLVALRGFCTATTPMEGHQRIIVCDLMRNGSLHDHLFGSSENRLSWPIRHKIAVGMARGLAYLHYGAQPAIIHRDIKASNILLDESFEPKVADFGLAKFTPEGMTHLSTRVAGTMGYVAPEYALYGQLTEKSDVYSFGVVLLELLSGKKALVSNSESQPSLVTDWAWSLVRKGRVLDVIEQGMADLGSTEVMEKYVLVAVLSSHPQMHARPTMDQILKILESDLAIPAIPERPIPLVAGREDIERSVSSSGSGHLSSPSGYQSFNYENASQSLKESSSL
ncbi:hypothetical protein AMTRI_Chr12g242040 [Amborella trichopoda]|uniref:non-specific serine/threonine protein kinase n=1 Tax=Amborella trichopoda TaxID=13333 RepID=W1PC36_AMBTC|nr:probable LRR receptor-like serine/threonine-protein kinase RKF3 [Amborella trichopoda]ERN07487.1 hypothetical protein AMTR_s00019p00256650 [Amborella trichopoda]|eukprot:XP_006845812.1 probable LRR receptor-like serine/threonine-protein kinase RKF3 [Amborella trichopoda]